MSDIDWDSGNLSHPDDDKWDNGTITSPENAGSNVGDVARTVGMGASGLGQMASNLAYAGTGSDTVKAVADKFGEWSDDLQEKLTPEMKSAIQKHFIADDNHPADAWSDPRSYLFQIANQVGSGLPMIGAGRLIGLGAEAIAGLSKLKPALSVANDAGAAASKAAMESGAEKVAADQAGKQAAQDAFSTEAAKVGVKDASLDDTLKKVYTANVAGQVAAGTYLHGSDAANAAMGSVAQMSHDDLMKSPEYADAYASYKQTMPDDQAQAKAKEDIRRAAGLTASEVTGGAAIPWQIAMSMVHAKLFTGGMGGTSRLGNFAKAAAVDVPANAAELGSVAFGGNVGVQQHANPNQSLSEDVADTALKAGIGAIGLAAPHLMTKPVSITAAADISESGKQGQDTPLGLPNRPNPTMYAFSDGSVGTQDQIDSHIASFPPDQQAGERARLMYGSKIIEPEQPSVPFPDAAPTSISAAANLSSVLSAKPGAGLKNVNELADFAASEKVDLATKRAAALEQSTKDNATKNANDYLRSAIADTDARVQGAADQQKERDRRDSLFTILNNPDVADKEGAFKEALKSSFPNETPALSEIEKGAVQRHADITEAFKDQSTSNKRVDQVPEVKEQKPLAKGEARPADQQIQQVKDLLAAGHTVNPSKTTLVNKAGKVKLHLNKAQREFVKTLPKESKNAVQEPKAGEVLQREPGQTGGAGGERGRVEPVQQGEKAAEEGGAAAGHQEKEAELIQPKGESNGTQTAEKISQQAGEQKAPAASAVKESPPQPNEPTPQTAEIGAAPTLTIGKTPKSTEPITVKNGVVHIGAHPAQNYETGEDVTVPEGATLREIKEALKSAGAIGKGQLIFGIPKEEPVKPETKPASKTEAAPEPSAPNPEEEAKRAHEVAARAAQKDAFTELSGVQALHDTVTNTPDAFRPSAEIELKKYLIKEGALALKSGDAVRAKAVYALLSDGKPNLPESFYDGLLKEIKQDLKQKRIESIKTLAKEELVSAMVALKIDGEANQAKFMDGWNHALAGKTKSTLASDEVTAKGYENAKAWLETEDGRAAYTGKRAKKLENTGADLRRWFDEKQSKITEGSTESIMDALDAATSRAELFRAIITPESTPGAQRWVEALRNNVLPFKRWFIERGPGEHMGSYKWRASDTDKIRSYLDEDAYLTKNGREESREARIQTMKQAADEYVKKVAMIVDSLDGKTVSSLVNSFSEFEAKQKYTNGEVINKSYTASRLADKTGYIVRDLLANEGKTIESTRKAPLTPPKLDRVDRDGEDYRKGQSVTPEQFKKRFNFADVGFGKWVSGKHDQDHLNYSYDAFYDLAKQLGIPTEAMSLGGQLHFTIGALGHGKFAAHYQGAHPHPSGGTVPVINVTKTKGDGTVAHEWSHALDLTHAPKPLNDAISEIKAELKFAYNMEVVLGTVHNMLTGDSYWQRSKNDKNSYEGRMDNAERAISRYGSQEHQDSKYYKAAQSLDGSNAGKDAAYWSNHKEIFARAFESWLGDVMEKSNTYLVNPGWSGDGVVTDKNYRGTPYPMGDERARFNKWFDALAKSLTYDKETKVLTVDPAKWAENKPNDREQWKNDIEEFKKKLPEMQRKVRDDQLAADKVKADLLAYVASLRAGDMVRAQPGKESLFRDEHGNNGAVISEVRDTGYGKVLYFEGSERGIDARNSELVQTREELQKAERDAREAVEAQQDKPSGKLSMQDLEQMFDTAASELQESNQEKPEAPAAGESLLATPKPATKEELSQLFKDRSGKLPNERKPIPSVSDKKALTLIAEAAKLGVKGADEALTGLAKLFGSGPGKLSSFPGGLNKETYEQAKPHFKSALKNFQEAGKTLNDLFKMLIQTLGIGIKPYAVQFAFDNDLEQNLGNKPASEAQNDRGTESESSSTLEGIPADDVGAPEGAGHSGPNAETGGDGGGEGNPRTDGGGGETGRSGGNGPADVHLPETGGKESKPGSKGGRGKGRTGVSKADRGANGKPESGTDLAPGTIPAMNFTITPDLNLGKGGESEKFTDNLDAIRTLKLIEQEHRRATADEQRIIARYVGWGGIPNAFKNAITGEFKKEWKARIEELESLLSPRELKQARASTTDAHFTSETVVNFMWRAAARLGYSGGMALENSVGIGNFIGLMPEHLRGNTFVTGIELDGITARMAAALYPQSSIINSGFQSVPLPEKTFDLNIGNPPFGQTSLRFQYNPELNGKSIHNQFFLGSINAVKPGGLQIMVVSRYLMDAQDAGTREELALKAKLLGAIRLPGSAFSENARTSVVTDILFLQRREAADEAKMMAAWAERNQKVNAKETSDQRYDREQRASDMKDEMLWTRTGKVPDSLGGDPMEVSRYYIENPHMIAGQMDRSGSMQYSDKEKGGTINVVLDKGENLADRLSSMFTNLPEVPAKLLSEEVLKRTKEMHKALGESLKIIASGREVGSIFYDDSGALSTIVERLDESGKSSVSKIEITADTPWSGQLAMDNNGKWYREVPKLDENGVKVKNGKLNVYHREVFQNEADIPKGLRIGDGPLEKLKSLVGIRELFLKQISLETSSAPVKDMEENRKELNKGYDSFVKKYGFISEPKNAAIISEMPDEGLILSLESKFKREVTAAKAKATGMKQAPSSAEKSAILLRPVGIPAARIDHADTIGDAIAVSLSESGHIDAQRIAQLMGKTEDEVIAEATGGDKPLAFIDPETNKLVEKNDYLSGNVRRKLEAARSANVQQNIKALEAVQPEAWPSDKVTARIGATWVPPEVYAKFMGDLLGEEARVKFSKLTNTFDVYGNHDSALATSKWGTKRFDAIKLYEAMLNSKGVAVYDTDSEGKRHFNEIESQAANDKKNELNEEFSNWVFKDSERRKMLTKLFNDIYNTRVNRQFDGSHMTFPGKVPDDVVAFRRSQTNAIWRGVVNNHVLYDHAVGAGKTFTAIARAIERKRMGISRKSMIVVPNHLVQEWAAQAYRLYPGAKVLAAGVNDLQSKNRRRMFAKIAAGDHDLVIVPHSSFQFISLSPETEERFVNEQMELAYAALKEAQQDAEEEAGGGKPFKPLSVKVAEALIKKLEERLEAIRNKKGKDRLLTFEQMGVDDLTVDECFPYDTPILTKNGWISIGEIVEKRLDVEVLSYNSLSHANELKKVTRWIPVTSKKTMVRVTHEHGHFTCTDDHKIWTKDGYVKAGLLTTDRYVQIVPTAFHQDGTDAVRLRDMQYDHQGMSAVQDGILVSVSGKGEQREAPVLRERVCSNMAQCPTWSFGEIQCQHGRDQGGCAARQEVSTIIGAHEAEQSHVQTRCTEENESVHAGEDLSFARREFSDNAGAADLGGYSELANGTCDSNLSGTGTLRVPSELLQGGSGIAGSQAGNRGGWENAQAEEVEVSGSAQNGNIEFSRVESVEVLERGSEGGSPTGGDDYSTVYDIEVEDNHNFYAAGVLVSNCHEFKNLMYSSRLPSDVRGLGTKQGSHKALDLYMKMKLLHENNGSAAFLSGTPISNSAVEMYTIMRYLAPDILKEQGLEHFDAYRTQFVDAAQAFEPTEAGNGIKIVNRLGRSWSNMRALMEGYTSVADMVTNDDIKAWYREDNPGKEFPLPNIKGGGRQAISVKPTAQQEDIIKTIISGYEGLPGISDIKERNKERLRLMDRARKVAISARTVDPRIEEEAGGKLDRVMDEALRIYKKWNSDKGTQLVFLDRSVPKSKGDDKVIKEYDDLRQKFREAVLSGNEEDQGKINDKLEKFDKDEIEELRIAQTANWNAYQHMADKLIASGIPRDEIAFIQNFSTDQQKKALFDAVNDGSVRFLFGSSPRMGAGMNVQERLVGLHHVDVDWKPSTIEQREGRIIRQGNSLYDKYGPSFDPEILAYVTERSMDAKMWDLNATKLRMINGIRMYDGEFEMDFNDEEAVGMAEIAAIASGDPLMLKRIKLSASMDDLYRKRRSYTRRVEAAQDALEDAKNDVQRIPSQIKAKTADVKVTADALQLAVKDQAKRKVMVGSTEFTTLMDALAHVSEQADKQQTVNGVRDIKLPISLSVDGKTLKSEDAVQAAIADKMGDANPFISEAGTAAYSNKIIRRLELARYIRSVIGETFVEIPEWKPVGTMYGLPLSVMTETLYGNAYANLKVDLGNGNDLTAYASIMPEKHTPGTPVPVNVVSLRAIIMRLDDELRNASSFKPAYLESKLQAAQENIKTLEETVKEKFKDEGALEDTKKQLDELEKTLNNRKAGATDDDSVSLEQMGSDYESSLTKKYALWDGKEQDPLYPKALELVQATKRGSISFIERNVHVPRDRAQRIIERMEQEGYVGPADLEGRHEVLAGSGTDIYAHQNLRSGITETQKEAGRNAYRAILGRHATEGSISLLGSAIAKDFKRQGGSALTGQTAKTIEDFAVLAQVLRDPRMETFRVFFTKEGKILSHTGISSGLPGTVTIVKPLAGESRQDALLRLYSDIRSQKEALGADGYWMVHNHPQGSPKPSTADEIVTSNFARNITGFKGHVVLDHDEYAVIDSDGNWKVISGELPKHFNADKAEIPNVLLGREVTTSVQVAVVGKQLERKDGYFTIIGRTNGGVVAAIADVPMSMMEGGKISQIRMRVLLKRFAVQTGSGDVVAVSDHLDMDKMGPLVQEGLLTDAVDTRGNSARLKLGINKDNGPKNVLFGNSDKFKSMQVNQDAAPYEAKSAARSRAIRQDEVKPEGKLQDRIAEAAKSSIEGIKAGFADLKDAYARTPEYGDKKKIIGKLTGQYQEIDFDLAKTAKKINSEVSKSTQEAIKQYMQAGGDEAVLRKRASEVPAKYRKPFDDALTLTPKDKEWAKQIYAEQQEWGTKAVEAGIIEHMIDNYVRGQWERENAAGQKMSALANSGMLNDHPREAMRKVFQNDYEGLKAGFVPVDQRIGFQHTAAQRSIRRALAARQALTDMMTAKEADGLPMTMLGGGGSMVEESSAIQSLRNEAEKARQAAKAEPKNAELQKALDTKYDELDAAVKKDESNFKDKPYFVKANMPPKGAMTADGRAYVKYDHPALRGWKWIGSDAAGSPILMQGSMYIHPDSVKDIHALLGKSAVREYTVPKFVPVIGGTRPGDAALKVGAYIKATMLSGTPFHQFHIGEHAGFHGVNPMNAPELSFDRKVKINGKEYAILREGVNHGMMVYNHNALQEFGEGLSGGGLLHQVPVLGKYIQQYGEYLFQDYIPRLKAAMFEKAVLRDVEHSKAELASGKVTMDQIFQRQAKHSNDAFGEQNYKYMGRDPSLQDALRLVALAPDFLESRMKFFGAALTPAGREQRIALIKGALIMGLGAQLLNLMFGDDHKTHWDRPFSVIIGGREYSPRSVVGDIAHVITDPRSFLYSRVNPLWGKPLIEGLSGRNQFGQKEDLQDGLNNVVKSWAPIATQGFFKNTQGQTQVQSVVGQLLATVGITNKQAKTPAEAEISDINFGHMKVAQKTAGEKKRYEGFVALKEAFIAGELNSMDDVRKQARESNLVLSKSQLQQIQSSRDITPEAKLKVLEQRMKNFSSEDALMVWEKASADERAELKPFIRAKILRSHTITGTDKMDALKSLNE